MISEIGDAAYLADIRSQNFSGDFLNIMVLRRKRSRGQFFLVLAKIALWPTAVTQSFYPVDASHWSCGRNARQTNVYTWGLHHPMISPTSFWRKPESRFFRHSGFRLTPEWPRSWFTGQQCLWPHFLRWNKIFTAYGVLRTGILLTPNPVQSGEYFP